MKYNNRVEYLNKEMTTFFEIQNIIHNLLLSNTHKSHG
jgi:hypothetical protein